MHWQGTLLQSRRGNGFAFGQDEAWEYVSFLFSFETLITQLILRVLVAILEFLNSVSIMWIGHDKMDLRNVPNSSKKLQSRILPKTNIAYWSCRILAKSENVLVVQLPWCLNVLLMDAFARRIVQSIVVVVSASTSSSSSQSATMNSFLGELIFLTGDA